MRDETGGHGCELHEDGRERAFLGGHGVCLFATQLNRGKQEGWLGSPKQS
jgi:hypothetical protein